MIILVIVFWLVVWMIVVILILCYINKVKENFWVCRELKILV